MEHSFDEANHAARADVWERLNRELPITNLRWSIDHVNTIEPKTLARIKALGVAVRAHGRRSLAGSPGQAAPIDPRLNVYYMVTGKNVRGELINDGQQITRDEAVWLYTGANGWLSRDEQPLGTIETGKLADLSVLSADVFDPKAVPDEAIKRVHSVMTFLGGRIVYQR